jgi:hypothetical protein
LLKLHLAFSSFATLAKPAKDLFSVRDKHFREENYEVKNKLAIAPNCC